MPTPLTVLHFQDNGLDRPPKRCTELSAGFLGLRTVLFRFLLRRMSVIRDQAFRGTSQFIVRKWHGRRLAPSLRYRLDQLE